MTKVHGTTTLTTTLSIFLSVRGFVNTRNVCVSLFRLCHLVTVPTRRLPPSAETRVYLTDGCCPRQGARDPQTSSGGSQDIPKAYTLCAPHTSRSLDAETPALRLEHGRSITEQSGCGSHTRRKHLHQLDIREEAVRPLQFPMSEAQFLGLVNTGAQQHVRHKQAESSIMGPQARTAGV